MSAKLVFGNLEICEANTDGIAVTLYFEGEPTLAEVIEACKTAKLPLTADTDDPHFSFELCQTVVSNRARLCRVQCSPCG